jgi:hypothetical protein
MNGERKLSHKGQKNPPRSGLQPISLEVGFNIFQQNATFSEEIRFVSKVQGL